MEQVPIQDQWPEPITFCWGCGRNNEQGLHVKSYWDGDETVCTWEPEEHHLGFLGLLNGGIIATIFDCHSLSTAVSAAYRAEDREIATEPYLIYVTGSLFVEYLRPTPLSKPVHVRARIKEMGERKIVVASSLFSDDVECARGEMVAVRVGSI